jgi:adenylate kinase
MAADLVREFNIPHISTGDIFRQNIKAGTPLGIEADRYIQQGALVPDAITIAMVADRLAQADCAPGFLLDGFPRTINQAEALNHLLGERGILLTAVIDLKIRDDLVIDRLGGRLVCSQCGKTYNLTSLAPKVANICDGCGGDLYQRDDDKPETIRKRLDNYYLQTLPVSDYYKSSGLLSEVRNEGEVGSSLPVVKEILRKRLQAC